MELKDYFILGLLIFNAGGWLYTFANHMRHANKSLVDIFKRLGGIEQRVSKIEGKLDD